MTHRFLLIVLVPKSAVPPVPQALLGLSRRPVKIQSSDSFETTRLILLQQAENKTDGSLGPFLISGHPIIFLFFCSERISPTEWLKVGLFWLVLSGHSRWTPVTQA